MTYTPRRLRDMARDEHAPVETKPLRTFIHERQGRIVGRVLRADKRSTWIRLEEPAARLIGDGTKDPAGAVRAYATRLLTEQSA